MRKSLVSLVALGLFLGAPAMAQTTTDEATSNQQSTQQQTTAPSAEQFEQMLGEYEARSEVKGHIVRAITPDGSHVLVLVGPRNLEPEQSVQANDSDISSRFEEGGFKDVVILGGPRIFRADLDDQHYIFALTADEMLRFGVQTGAATDTEMGRDETVLGETDTETTVEMGQTDTEMQMDPQTGTQSGTTMSQTDNQTGTQSGTTMGQADTQTGTQSGTTMGQADTQTGTQTGTQSGTQSGTTMGQTDTETGQVGRALSEPDADRIVSNLEEAGLQEADEFQGRLVKAMTATDRPMFFVITSKDMESGQIDINEDDISQKLESAGLRDVQFIDDAKIVRGNLEDDHVFVLAGDLFSRAGQQ